MKKNRKWLWIAALVVVNIAVFLYNRKKNSQTPPPTATQTQVRFLQEDIKELRKQSRLIMQTMTELDALNTRYFDKLDSLNEVSADQLSDIRRYNLQGRDAIRQLRASMEKLQPEINELVIEAEKFEE